MAIKVLWGKDGPYAVADTASEALELIKLGRNGRNGHKEPAQAAKQLPLNKAETLTVILDELTPRCRHFLMGVGNFGVSGIEGTALSEKIGEGVDKFGGLLGAISKVVSSHGLDIEDLIISEMRFDGPKRYRHLQAGPLLKDELYLVQASLKD